MVSSENNSRLNVPLLNFDQDFESWDPTAPATHAQLEPQQPQAEVDMAMEDFIDWEPPVWEVDTGVEVSPRPFDWEPKWEDHFERLQGGEVNALITEFEESPSEGSQGEAQETPENNSRESNNSKESNDSTKSSSAADMSEDVEMSEARKSDSSESENDDERKRRREEIRKGKKRVNPILEFKDLGDMSKSSGLAADKWLEEARKAGLKTENAYLRNRVTEMETLLRQIKDELASSKRKRDSSSSDEESEHKRKRKPKPAVIADVEDAIDFVDYPVWADVEDDEYRPRVQSIHPGWIKSIQLRFDGEPDSIIKPRTYAEHIRLVMDQLGHKFTDHQKRSMFSMGLRDRARTWFDGWMREQKEKYKTDAKVRQISYLKFVHDFLRQHQQGDPAELARDRMLELEYENLDQWVADWREILQEAPKDVSEPMRITLFKKQCPTGLKLHLLKCKPKTLSEAISIAYDYASVTKLHKKAAGSGSVRQAGRRRKQKNKKRVKKDASSDSDEEGSGGNSKKKKKGCFICGSLEHWKKDCPKKGKKKKQNKENNKADDEIYFDVPVSLNTLEAKWKGVKPEALLVIEININGKPVSALLDCGATNNYLNENIVAEIPNLEIGELPRKLNVATVMGNRSTTKMTTLESLQMGTFEDRGSSLVILPLGEKYGAILGMPFLVKNNPKIDWLEPKMLIDRNGMTHFIPIRRATDKKVELFHIPAKPEKLRSWRRMDFNPKEDQAFVAYLDPVEDNISEKPSLSDLTTDQEALQDNSWKELVQEFNDLFPEELPSEPISRPGFDHEINLKDGTDPPRIRPYRLSPVELEEVRRNIDEMLEKGYIQPSNSPYSSPLLFVKKKNGELRMCNDYRALNKITISDAYPLPRIDQLYDTVGKAKYFTALDLKSGYYQIKIRDKDTPKTAFSCRFGNYEYRVMPFGLKNAPATFQRLMNYVFKDLLDVCVLVYLDDILIFSKTREEHLKHIRIVFERLRKFKLFVNLKKCQFWLKEVLYLGFQLSNGSIKVDPAKIGKIRTMARPTNRKQVQQYLGFVNYFGRFIPNAAEILAPISNLLRGKGKKGTAQNQFVWTPECEKAFEKTKILLTSAPILRVPDMSRPFLVTTDASQTGIAGMLSQEFGDGEHPVAFTSRKLTDAEKNYTVYEQEMLAVVHCCAVWRCYVENMVETVVRTDHYSLKHLLNSSATPANRRVARWIQKLQGLNLRIEHRRGVDNKVADALSRLEMNYTVSLKERDETWLDVLKHKIQHHKWPEGAKSADISKAEKKLQYFTVDGTDLVYREQSDQDWVYFVPLPERANLMFEVHQETGHQAWENTYKMLKGKVYWPSLRQDVKDWITQCYECRSRRVPNQPQTPIHPLKIQEVFASWHLDNTGPLPKTESGNEYTITARESNSRWFIAKAVKEINARQHAIFIYEEIYMQFGMPEEIITDQGSAFCNEVLNEFLKILQVKHRRTTPYHPRSNGKVERAHRDFHDRLAFLVKGLVHRWDLFIPEAVWAMRTQVNRITGYSPYYLVYGKEPRTSVDPIARPFIFDLSDPRDAAEKRARDLEDLGKAREAAKERMKLNNQKQIEQFNKRIHSKKEVRVGDLVQVLIPKHKWVKLGPRSEGPYKVVEVTEKDTVKLQDPKDPNGPKSKYISRDNVTLVGTSNLDTQGRKEFHGIEIKVPHNKEIRKHVWTPQELKAAGIRAMP